MGMSAKDRAAAMRHRRLSQGLCVACAKGPLITQTLCESCRDGMRARNRARSIKMNLPKSLTRSYRRTKVCNICKQEKTGRRGDRLFCKPCHNKSVRGSARRTIEAGKCVTCCVAPLVTARHCETCAQKNRMRARMHARANPEKNRQKADAWRKANPGRAKKNTLAWKKENPARVRAHNAFRDNRKRSNGGEMSEAEWRQILAEANGRCLDCRVILEEKGSSVRRPTRGHIVPASLGGSFYSYNIVAQCQSCNSSQGTRVHPLIFSELMSTRARGMHCTRP